MVFCEHLNNTRKVMKKCEDMVRVKEYTIDDNFIITDNCNMSQSNTDNMLCVSEQKQPLLTQSLHYGVRKSGVFVDPKDRTVYVFLGPL